VQVGPGQIAESIFANVAGGVAAAADTGAALLTTPATPVDKANDDIAPTDDVWLNTEEVEQTNRIYLPFVNHADEESVTQP